MIPISSLIWPLLLSSRSGSQVISGPFCLFYGSRRFFLPPFLGTSFPVLHTERVHREWNYRGHSWLLGHRQISLGYRGHNSFTDDLKHHPLEATSVPLPARGGYTGTFKSHTLKGHWKEEQTRMASFNCIGPCACLEAFQCLSKYSRRHGMGE